MATIQVDLVMLPERFDLTYIDEEGKEQRPIAIHRAIYGSLERFIGILVEHFAGAFPLWMRAGPGRRHPDRRSAHRGRPRSWPACSATRGLRVEVDGSSNRMQYKIRAAQEQKVPYMVVLGDREIEARTASPRTRAGEQQPPEAWERSPTGWPRSRGVARSAERGPIPGPQAPPRHSKRGRLCGVVDLPRRAPAPDCQTEPPRGAATRR